MKIVAAIDYAKIIFIINITDLQLMHFLVDSNKKVAIGWTAKSGCSHIKNLFYFLIGRTKGHGGGNLHAPITYKPLPADWKDYTIILIIRNPYKRIVSGFMDKYRGGTKFRNKWNKSGKPITFRNFVEELSTTKYRYIDKHHFAPHLAIKWNDDIRNHDKLVIYELENIDYSYLEKLYDKKIPDYVLKFRGQHFTGEQKAVNHNVMDITLDELSGLKPPASCYYDEDIKDKVRKIFIDDFIFFESHGFHYDAE